MDYASSVWMHTGKKSTKAMDRAQRIGAQAVTGSFRTVSLAVAEAEAYVRPVHQRHQDRATNLWISIQTLPGRPPSLETSREGIQTLHLPAATNSREASPPQDNGGD